jgi:hypothetical protein
LIPSERYDAEKRRKRMKERRTRMYGEAVGGGRGRKGCRAKERGDSLLWIPSVTPC